MFYIIYTVVPHVIIEGFSTWAWRAQIHNRKRVVQTMGVEFGH